MGAPAGGDQAVLPKSRQGESALWVGVHVASALCVQLFYNLSDPATEGMLYEVERVRHFTDISLKKVPDMKLHVGVDDQSGLVHSLVTTSANMGDLRASEELLHGEEVRVWGDGGYCGTEKREAHADVWLRQGALP